MECDPMIQNEIQEAIDKFVFKGKPWVAADRRYIEAKKGGTELIKIQDYGDALRTSWAKRDNKGLWSSILKGETTNQYESIYTTSGTLHKMHWPLKHITNAFERFCVKHAKQNDTTKFYTPIKYLEIIEHKIGRKKATNHTPKKHDLPAIFIKDTAVNTTLRDLSLSLHLKNTNKPKIIFANDLDTLLGLDTIIGPYRQHYTYQIKKVFTKHTDMPNLNLSYLKK